MKKSELVLQAVKLFDALPAEYIEEELIPKMQTAATIAKIMRRDADREVERRLMAKKV